MSIWETLGIEPTHDVKAIRRRYAELVRHYHPEDQPEIYQQIVEAYQVALNYARSINASSEIGLRKPISHQQESQTCEETQDSASSFLDFDTLHIEEEQSQEEGAKSLLDFSDYKRSTASIGNYEEPETSLNFETLKVEEAQLQEETAKSTLDFSDYNETSYIIRNSIESIIGNADYSFEEQENLWSQFFSQYRYDMSVVQTVLEEMDVYIFNKPEQFSIIIPLLKDYVPDFRNWSYYYKLNHWEIKRAGAVEKQKSIASAKEETEQFYASYLLCQEILKDSKKANQLTSWIDFFKHPHLAFVVLFQVSQKRQIIKSVPVLTYILEKVRQVMFEEDREQFDDLAEYLKKLKVKLGENVDFNQYSLDNPDEVEVVFYELLNAHYEDDYSLLRDWQFLFERVKDQSLLLSLLEKVDVYPLKNKKVLTLILQFVERSSDEESNPYLKKLQFWNIVQSYPSVVKEFELDNKENFEYWYYEGYLYVEKLTKSDELINDWDEWKQYFKEKPRILTVLFEQIYKEYRRFTDGEVLRFVLGRFTTSKIAPHMMTEETDKKLEEMTAYAYELSYPKSKLSYSSWKKRQIFTNKFLQFVFAVLTVFSLIQSTQEQRLGLNSWVYVGMVSLFYYYILRMRQTPMEEGDFARGMKPKLYYNLNMWVMGILFLFLAIPFLPLGLIVGLSFITFFCFIDGFKVNKGPKWNYSLDWLTPIGIFLSAGFLSALAKRSQLVSGVVIFYSIILIILLIILSFTRLSLDFPPSLKKIFFPSLIGILLFQFSPLIHFRLSYFDPMILRQDTLSLTVMLLLNAVAMSYFTKEQRLIIGVKKVFIIYSLQLFIFLRRFLRILFFNIAGLRRYSIEVDTLIMNSEVAFFFLEGLFVLMLILLFRNIRKGK